MHILGHCPWLPGYIGMQTVLLTLTMAGLFPDKPHIPNRITSFLGEPLLFIFLLTFYYGNLQMYKIKTS